MCARSPLLILLCAAACARGSSEENLLAALGEMRAAQIDHDHNNDRGFLAHAAAAVRKSPGHPFARYTLACAYGRAGRADEAVAELDQLAAHDIVFDVDRDSDFDPIRRAPAFAALRIRLAAIRARRVERSRVAFRLAARDLLTEGIAHDDETGDFFLSSVHHRKIVRVASDGRASDFVTDPALYGVLALAVDRPRRLLWACSSTMPEMDGFAMAESGRGALFAFDLSTAAQKARLPLPGPGRHNCNDLALDAKGGVLVADPLAHTIFRLAPGGRALAPVVPPGRLQSPQG